MVIFPTAFSIYHITTTLRLLMEFASSATPYSSELFYLHIVRKT
jgi:hypothetical protein